MKRAKLEKETRRIFHKIHSSQGATPEIYNRLTSLLNCEYLQEKNDFFKDKICLDAGCGSNANATFSMLQMGAKKVHAFDLDKSIFETVPKLLKRFGERFNLSTGSVLKINYPDGFFDFVNCTGVLHHTADAIKGIEELARVTKKNGTLFITIQGKGGLIKEITNFLRNKYAKDREFKQLIDRLDEKHILRLWDWITKTMQSQGDRLGSQISTTLIRELLNKDLVLTIKDRITAPTYTEFTEKEITECLRKSGFIRIKRLTRYPQIKNVRRFLCPFYYEYDNEFSRLFYGEGHIQIKAQKAK